MTLSGFRALPRQGHLERAQRVVGYLAKMKHAVIRFRVSEPDYSDLPHYYQYNSKKSIYGDVMEDIPTDAPKPLGKYVLLTHYLDANLYHDMLTGRSVSGMLHFLNQTPLDWFSKKQGSVETATYGSEFMASRICVEQIIDLRLTLRYLGVPIRDQSYMFGDNEAVVNSGDILHCLFIGSARQMRPTLSDTITSQVSTTQRMCSVNIGPMATFGSFYSHCCSGRATLPTSTAMT
jgi:hypothetical protein